MVLPSLTECAAIIDRLAPVLLDTAAKTAIVFGVAGFVALAMRRASAAARHWIWFLGFASVAILPILSASLPTWRVLPLLTANRAVAPAPVNSPTITALLVTPAASDKLDVTIPIRVEGTDPVPSHMHHEAAGTPPVQSAVLPPAAPKPIDLPALQVTAPFVAHSIQPLLRSWTIWLVAVWMAGSLLLLTQVFLGYFSLWMLQRRCVPIRNGDLPTLLNDLRRQFHVRGDVELLSSPMRSMPMTWGLWRARLLLPEEALQWSREQGRAVLLHELAHIQRWDCLTQLLAQVICALYWFNPLTWIAARRMQIERERACDDRVLNTGVEPSVYARHLLHSASAMPALGFSRVAIAMARPSTLEERLRAIMDTHRNRRSLTTRASVVTALMLLATLVPMAVLRAQEKPPQAEVTEDQQKKLPITGATGAPAAIRPDGFSTRSGSRSGPGPAAGMTSSRSVPTKGDGPTCSLDATIYDVRLPIEQIGRLDGEALEKAASSADTFEKALAALGTSHPLYRASQSVRLSSDTISITTQNPVVTNTSVRDNGQTINSVTYQSTGAHFTVAGNSDNNGAIDLDLSIQLSAISEGGTAISDKVKAPLMRSATISHKGIVMPHKPFVVISVDAASPDPGGKAVAYIGRIILGDLQRATPPAAHE